MEVHKENERDKGIIGQENWSGEIGKKLCETSTSKGGRWKKMKMSEYSEKFTVLARKKKKNSSQVGLFL